MLDATKKSCFETSAYNNIPKVSTQIDNQHCVWNSLAYQTVIIEMKVCYTRNTFGWNYCLHQFYEKLVLNSFGFHILVYEYSRGKELLLTNGSVGISR